MGAHIQIIFSDIQPEQQEWTIAHLAEAGYEGFEEKATELIAFIPEDKFDRALLSDLAFKYQLTYAETRLEERNWNKIWESNFEPVIIDGFVCIRADFHKPTEGVRFDIVITPKMSFGTGHHATTGMMIGQLRDLDLTGKRVFDFGTGTGILAILSEKLGAEYVLGIDHDEWSIWNATENIHKNGCSRISVELSDQLPVGKRFDLILANINRNVIAEHFVGLVQLMEKEASLIVSGMLVNDTEFIQELAGSLSLKTMNHNVKGQWISMRFDR